jgi:nitrite reductase (NADH) small subunit/3-phenylpropionate/trans-cinnamate dioxygenase ferredoxin subunit
MAWTTLCRLDELTEGEGRFVQIDGFQLGVYLDRGQVFAMDDRCPHAGASLSAGVIFDGCAVCPRHNWAFRLENGELRDAPGVTIRTYRTRFYEHQGVMLVQAELPLY